MGGGVTSKKANLGRLRGNTAIWSMNELRIFMQVRVTLLVINTSPHRDEPLRSALDLKRKVWCLALNFVMVNTVVK